MPYQADIAGYNQSGELVLAVEVKTKRGVSRDWAAKMRRNLLAHGIIHDSAYFLLAHPDRLFLWKGGGHDLSERLPSYEVDPTALFAPYFEASKVKPDHISKEGFALIVADWLDNLMRARDIPAEFRQQQSWLFDSGLFDALRGGRFAYEVAA